MGYVYKSPEGFGYRKEKVSSRKEKNQILQTLGIKNRKWMYHVEKYVKDTDIRVEVYTSTIVKVLNTLCLPLAILFFGIANWKETFFTVKDSWNEKELGKFFSYRIPKEVS